MKVNHVFIIAVSLLIINIILISGCSYDVAEPMWDKTGFNLPAESPVVNSINPPEGTPGVNTITIIGENFELVPNSNILLDIPRTLTVSPEIVEKTSTSIVIRRPNLVTDSLFVKVWRDSGLVEKFGPYKVGQVIEQYGAFFENEPLRAVLADNSGNIYVAADTNLYFVDAQGNKSIFAGRPARNISSAVLNTDGKLILLTSNRIIEQFDPVTGEFADWYRLGTNRQLRIGAFDSHGYFYTAGNRTDLWVVAPDSTDRATNLFPTSAGDSILAAHIYNSNGTEYLYLVVGAAAGRSIQRFAITAGGALGAMELVTNLNEFSGPITDFTISSDGNLFISMDSPNSLLVFEPSGNKIDYFYKGIIPPYMKQIIWGTGNHIYIITGNTTPAQNWSLHRVNMGTTKAPGFGG